MAADVNSATVVAAVTGIGRAIVVMMVVSMVAVDMVVVVVFG